MVKVIKISLVILKHRRNRVFSTLAVGTVITGLVVSGTPGRAAAATTSSDIYVDNAPPYCNGSPSTDPGKGTAADPFCTIGAATAIVQPGQTVMVEEGDLKGVSYPGQQTISVSGTASEPITFDGSNGGASASVDDFLRVGRVGVDQHH